MIDLAKTQHGGKVFFAELFMDVDFETLMQAEGANKKDVHQHCMQAVFLRRLAEQTQLLKSQC